VPKTDFKVESRALYAPPRGSFTEIVVPPMVFLAIDGQGDPNTSQAYREAVEALFAASYAAKFLSKREDDLDYVVGPLEGLWSADDLEAFARRDKSRWSWTMLVRQPEWLAPSILERALAAAAQKHLVAAPALRREVLDEGLCVQTLHVGSYDAEAPVIADLHGTYLPAHHLVATGRHHEIYLNDPRRTEPAKLKVVLRQPVARDPE